MLIRNKKAQIGETMTWVVATIIILVVLVLFVAFSAIIAGKKVATLDFQVSRDLNLAELGDEKNSDLLAMKSFSAYLLTNKGGVYEELKVDLAFNDNTGPLSVAIYNFIPKTAFLSTFRGNTEVIALRSLIHGVYVRDQTGKRFEYRNEYYNRPDPFLSEYLADHDKRLELNYFMSDSHSVSYLIIEDIEIAIN